MMTMTTSPSKLENELALLVWHMRMNRMTPRESAIYHNTLWRKKSNG